MKMDWCRKTIRIVDQLTTKFTPRGAGWKRNNWRKAELYEIKDEVKVRMENAQAEGNKSKIEC